MKYIKDVFSIYNPWFDNYGVKLYHVYEILGIKIKIRYRKLTFTYSSEYGQFLKFIQANNVKHEIYIDF